MARKRSIPITQSQKDYMTEESKTCVKCRLLLRFITGNTNMFILTTYLTEEQKDHLKNITKKNQK